MTEILELGSGKSDTPLLAPDEIHPCTKSALDFIMDFRSRRKSMTSLRNFMFERVMAGDRLAIVCFDTLDRIELDKVVTDREVMGLAWLMGEFISMNSKFVTFKEWGRTKRRKVREERQKKAKSETKRPKKKVPESL